MLRRQAAVGRTTPAGSSRHVRLDPFTLPVRFAVGDRAADGRVRVVELSRDHVVLRRAVRGIKMAIKVRTAAYLGVAIRIEPPREGEDGAVAVVLEHRDPGLSLPLYRAADGTDIVAEWQSWARALHLPRSEEHTSELQSRPHLVCRLLLEKKKENTSAVYVFSEKQKQKK